MQIFIATCERDGQIVCAADTAERAIKLARDIYRDTTVTFPPHKWRKRDFWAQVVEYFPEGES